MDRDGKVVSVGKSVGSDIVNTRRRHHRAIDRLYKKKNATRRFDRSGARPSREDTVEQFKPGCLCGDILEAEVDLSW
jgi:hypothetical protein